MVYDRTRAYIIEDIEILGHGVPPSLCCACVDKSASMLHNLDLVSSTIVWKKNCVVEIAEVIACV